jgi:hypothetical protein
MMENYVDVAERIRQFRAAFPTGSLQPLNLEKPFEIVEIGGKEFIIYAAAAYRTPDDPRPGIGLAQEQAIGGSNFTRGSELQNAETSAWGRAIVAALAADTQKIASLEEVRNRKAEQEESIPAPTPKQIERSKKEHPASSPAPSSAPIVSIDSTDANLISSKQIGLINFIGKEQGMNLDELKELIGSILEKSDVSISHLTKREATRVIDYLKNLKEG